MNQSDDALPLWWLYRAADMPQRELVPLLRRIGLPITADVESGHFYTSRTEFGELLREAAE